ncbi:hypothetical protein J1D01_08245 [Seonamhaeicola sp. NFXS20]|uniref:hypothetical protein n=1 Tax=Seonamhaeicola sp. NFXS20 TaxID=2816959 RepID=UPI003B8B3906
MMKYLLKVSVTFVLVLIITPGYSQSLQPSTLFSNNMVLQQGMDVPVWGTAAPNEKITVSFANQIKTTTANNEGKWMLKLSPLKATKIPTDMVISGSTEVKISNIVVGEVWICSGQSNMQFNVNQVPEIKALIPFANNIRSFEVKRTVSYNEEENAIGKWKTTHPSSAVAFGFAYFLESIGDVPVGIIHASWGSSSIEAWMPKDMGNNLPYFKTIMNDFDADIETRKKIEKITSKTNGWSQKEDIFLRRQPNILYNAMMKPLAPFACRGLVWYQGERNTRYLSGVPEVDDKTWFHRVIGMKEYGDVLKQWIKRYRKEWNNDKMFFNIVMLPGYGKGTAKKPEIDPESPTEESFAWLRESQLKALDLPYTAVANTIDLGDVKNIHPTDKYPIGQRLALLGAKNTLNKDVVAEGPMLKNIEQKTNTLIVYFKNSQGLKTTDKKAPTGFWIADASLNWKKAEAKIENETVILSNKDIKNPLYVRYAFAGKPTVNLVNGANLPAYPFRTDKN